MVRGVCAGIADYLDVPVKLVRILQLNRCRFSLGWRFFYRSGLYRFCLLYWTLCRIIWPQEQKPQPTSGELLDTNEPESFAAGESVVPKWNAARHVRYVHTA